MNSLEFAIKMELDGQEYYLKCAEKNKDNRLHNLFLSLAADEENHGKIIKNKLDEISYKLEENASLKDFDNVFKSTESISPAESYGVSSFISRFINMMRH